MDGFALVKNDKGMVELVPCSTETKIQYTKDFPQGRAREHRPTHLADGRKVWNWTSNARMAQRLANAVNNRVQARHDKASKREESPSK